MEQQIGVADKEEIRVDLLELFGIFRRKWWLLLLSMVIGGILSGVVSMVVLPLKYTSSAMLYVLSKETTLTSLADLQIGSGDHKPPDPGRSCKRTGSGLGL